MIMQRDEIVKQIQNAMAFLGQAQELAPTSSELWNELGTLYSDLDELQSSVQCSEYDDTGNFDEGAFKEGL
jgi:hypothetical protein